MKLPDWLSKVLDSFAMSTDAHNEVEIFEAIRTASTGLTELSEDDKRVAHAEWAAFGFYERPGKDSVWGTYFAPMMTGTRTDGTDFRSPDIADLDRSAVEHWEERAKSVEQPVMRARYADVVWDLKKAITNERPSHEFAQIAIDAYVDAAEKRLYRMDIEAVGWLRRALDLSLSLKDGERAKRVAKSILDFRDATENTQRIGIWVFPFDSLFGRKNLLTSDQEKKIIDDLEDMLKKTSAPGDGFDPHGAEAAAERLAQHYRRLGDSTSVRRVVTTYGEAFTALAKDAGPMLATAWLQPVIERYEQEGLKAEAEQLQKLFSEKAKGISSEMKEVSVPIEIPQEEMDRYIEEITADDLHSSLLRIAVHFVPKVEDTRKLLETLQRDAPLLSMISVTRFDEDGRPVGRIGSLEEDPDGRLHEQLGRSISIQYPFLALVLDRLRERYAPTTDALLAFLGESPLFPPGEDDILAEGLTAYWNGDFVKAIHVLVPRVEHTLRKLLALLGIPTVKTVPRHPGIMDVKSMNDALEEPRVRQALTEDIWRYLVVLYIDRKSGLNLRNDIAHGLARRGLFNRAIADRVFQSLLVLSLVRVSEKKPAVKDGGGDEN